MSSDQDKPPPRPNPHIGAELGVESVPLSERSRRISESAGQASLAYASSGPTNVPAPENVTTDMPPVILDPKQAPAGAPIPPGPSSSGGLRAAAAFSSVSGVKAVPKATVRMPNAPVSSPQIIAEANPLGAANVSSSGPYSASPASFDVTTPSSRKNARSRTVVVRARRASPIEKAFAFAAALVLICTIGAAIFYWQGKGRVSPPPSPPAHPTSMQAPR